MDLNHHDEKLLKAWRDLRDAESAYEYATKQPGGDAGGVMQNLYEAAKRYFDRLRAAYVGRR